MLPGMMQLGFLGSTFIPITNTYDSGSGTETVPEGARFCTIIAQGAGGGGGLRVTVARLAGGTGGKGGKVTKNIFAVTPGDTISYSVGSLGSGALIPGGDGDTGGNTTVNSGTGSFSSINITASGGGGGSSSGSDGSTGNATGGDINTVGGADGANGADAVYSPDELGWIILPENGEQPGGGGGGSHENSESTGGNGANGRVSFSYT